MPGPPREESTRASWKETLVSGMAFVLLYAYLVLVIDTHLIYDGFWKLRTYPSFFCDWRFVRDFFLYPGGPIECLGRLFSQCFCYRWLGAFIVATMTWGICRCAATLIALASGGRPRVMPYAPALLVLIMYNRWDNPLAACLALMAALLFSVVYEKTPVRRGEARAFLYVVLSVVLYCVAGGASLVLAVLAGIYEILTQRRRLLGAFCVLFGLLVPWLVGALGFDLLTPEAYLSLLPFHPQIEFFSEVTTWTARGLYLLVPLAVLLAASCNLLAQRSGVSRRETRRKTRAKPARGKEEPRRSRSVGLRKGAQAALLILVIAPSLFYSFDPIELCYNKMTHFSRNEMWSEVLELGRHLPLGGYSPYWNHDINRALYHTGRLGYDMFAYRQEPEALLLFYGDPARPDYPRLSKIADISLELGEVNVAEKLMSEILENQGESPYTLERLALANMVKGEIGTARVFLTALSTNPLHAKRAKRMLRRLDEDPDLLSDERVQRLRSAQGKRDDIALDVGQETMLKTELEENQNNRMAFEYLMAHYLATARPDKIVENLGRLNDFDYKEIPRLYEEAILVYQATTGQKADTHGRSISADAQRRFERAVGLMTRYSKDPRAAWAATAPLFGDSYFFYHSFRESGVSK